MKHIDGIHVAGAISAILASALWSVLLVPSWGRTHYPGQWDNIPPGAAAWYKAQMVPGQNMSCCSQADATHAVEDRRDGHYWAKFEACGAINPDTNKPICVPVEFMEVPDTAVLKNYRPTDPNVSLPVVWWGWQEGHFFIRCYAPEPDA